MDDQQYENDQAEAPESPTQKPNILERFVEQLRKWFAPDIEPTDQVRILLRFAMIIGVVYYLGTGIIGILST
ncbi:hypothetical protein RFF05_16405 [Bengtsoniella intestinalis]|uniref:hypothetical protein n=1 Tax=Bengtsoniella intestinalis TaxID=3073143 RepID=UPI00391F340E